MALTKGKVYLCGYCKTPYPDQYKADKCRDDHDLVYIPLSRSDLNRLINFMYIKDESLLSKTLVETLTMYVKGNSTRPERIKQPKEDIDFTT